jgi:outer membrane biosynthesis protein TonB
MSAVGFRLNLATFSKVEKSMSNLNILSDKNEWQYVALQSEEPPPYPQPNPEPQPEPVPQPEPAPEPEPEPTKPEPEKTPS